MKQKRKAEFWQNKKRITVFSVIVGVVFLLYMLLNVGFNLWLKYKLPDYIKANSSYTVQYKSLTVNAATGSIHATAVQVKTKATDPQILGVEGKIDTLTLSQIGLYRLMFSKTLSAKELILSGPQLKLVLPKPKDKSPRSQNPFFLNSIAVRKGDLSIFRFTGQKVLSVKNLSAEVRNLKLKSEDTQKLPFTYDTYTISGSQIFYRLSNLYAVTITKITTADGELRVSQPRLTPLLSVQKVKRFYPEHRSLFSFNADEIRGKDIHFKSDIVVLKEANLINPTLEIYSTGAAKKQNTPEPTPALDFAKVNLTALKLRLFDENGSPKISIDRADGIINRFTINEELSKKGKPFGYDAYDLKVSDLNLHADGNLYSARNIRLLPKETEVKSVQITSAAGTDLKINTVSMHLNEWGFKDKKLFFDVNKVGINTVQGKYVSKGAPAKKQNPKNGLFLPLKIGEVDLKNASFTYEQNGKPFSAKNLKAKLTELKYSGGKSAPFSIKDFNISGSGMEYRLPFYQLKTGGFTVSEKDVHVLGFSLLPTVSRSQFIKMIPQERDLYTLKAAELSGSGNWDLWTEKAVIVANQITVQNADANIFRSKLPQDDLSEKQLYSKLLRDLKFLLFIQNLDLKNSRLIYEEDTEKSSGPGKLEFTQFNLNAKNINSVVKGRPTQIPIAINCRFMDASPMKVLWTMDTSRLNDHFTIAGNISNLSAARINPFVEPYLKIRATGEITELAFDFEGDRTGIQGPLKMKHKDLKVSILNQEGQKKTVLSAVANLFVKSNSGKYPPTVIVEHVERDKTRSFFNLFWRGIEEGLKKTLLGIGNATTKEKLNKTESPAKIKK